MNKPKEMTQFILIEKPLDTVWEALTEPSHMTSWLCNKAEVELKAGGKFDFSGKTVFQSGGGQVITALEPNKMLAFNWTFNNTVSQVTLTLEAQLDMTRIVVKHENFGEWAPSTMFDIWKYSFAQLKYYLEYGKPNFRANLAEVPEGDVVELSIDIPASAEDIFAAVSTAKGLDNWISTNAEVTGGLGGTVDYGWGSKEEITELIPDEKITHGFGPGAKVTWTVKKKGVHATLTMVHSGFADRHMLECTFYGWSAYFVTMAIYIMSKKPVYDWSTREEQGWLDG